VRKICGHSRVADIFRRIFEGNEISSKTVTDLPMWREINNVLPHATVYSGYETDTKLKL
jgi:hypothetical protein